MNAPEFAGPDLDPALERLMSEMDDALFEGRPTDDFEREIAEQFGESPSHIVATLKALHSARAVSLSMSASPARVTEAPAGQTHSTSEATTWIRATSGLAKTVFDRFEILERLGSGGAGTVFRARDSRLERLIALKVARAEALFSGEAKQRFVREAQTLAALRHPNIIPIYEFGESGGLPFIVEELCEGPNLAIWLRQNVDARRKVPIRTAVNWTLLLAEAVAHAHRCGIVHRDLKPSNVLLAAPAQNSKAVADRSSEEHYVPRVTDFGIAKLFESDESVTASQAVLGTAAYMAPEQAEGRSREVGPPADVYSLGVILFELLTGRRPIEGRSDVDTLRRVLTDDPLPLRQVRRDVPRDLEAICLKCLDKDSANRYLSAAELATDLRHFLQGEPVAARRLRPMAGMIRRLRRRQASSVQTIVTFLALSLVIAFGLLIVRTRNGDIVIWQTRDEGKPPVVVANSRTYPDDIHRADQLLRRAEPDVGVQSAMADEVSRILGKYITQDNEEDLRGFEWHYLWKISHPQTPSPLFAALRSISAHGDVAYFVSFSPDGQYVATASIDHTARLWDVGTGKLRAVLAGHTDEVNCVAFSPDGKTLATASDDRTVRLWDVSTGKFREVIWKHTSEIIGVAFNPMNGQLACSAADGVVSIFDGASSKLITRFPAHPGNQIDDVAFSLDGKLLATAGTDAIARLWDVANKYRQIAEFRVPDARSIGFSHDGQRLSVGGSYEARIFRIGTRELLAKIPIPGQKVRCVQFTSDDSSLLTAGDKSAACLVDLTTGEVWDPFDSAADVLWCAAFSRDGRRAATTDARGKLVLWDCSARAGFHRRQLDVPAGSPAARLAISADGGKIAVVADAAAKKDGPGAELTVWDVSALDAKPILRLSSSEPGCQFRDVAFSPDGSTLALGERLSQTGKERIRIVDAATGAAKLSIDASRLDGFFYTPGGSILVSRERPGGTGGAELRIRDARTGTLVRSIALKSNPTLFAFSARENLFASTGGNHGDRIDLYRVPNEPPIAALNGFGETIHSLAISSDGQLLVGRGDGGYIAVVSCETGTLTRQFTVPGVESIDGFAMAISPDGHALALGSKDGIVLADFPSGKAMCLLRFPNEMKEVRSVAYASDGRTVAATTVSPEGQCGVSIWQVHESFLSPPRVEAVTTASGS